MEPWQITFMALYGGVLGYLAISQVQQGKMISAMSSMIDSIKIDQERLERQVNLFLKSEVDTMKELVKQGHELIQQQANQRKPRNQ
jgi:hypothetical protein